MSRFQNSLFHKRLNNILISHFKISRSLQNSQNNNKKHSTFPVFNRENMSGLTQACTTGLTHLYITESGSEILHRNSIPEPPDLHLGNPPGLAVDVDPGVERLRYHLPQTSLLHPGGGLGLSWGVIRSVMKVCRSLEQYNQHYPHICKCFLNLQL